MKNLSKAGICHSSHFASEIFPWDIYIVRFVRKTRSIDPRPDRKFSLEWGMVQFVLLLDLFIVGAWGKEFIGGVLQIFIENFSKYWISGNSILELWKISALHYGRNGGVLWGNYSTLSRFSMYFSKSEGDDTAYAAEHWLLHFDSSPQMVSGATPN